MAEITLPVQFHILLEEVIFYYELLQEYIFDIKKIMFKIQKCIKKKVKEIRIPWGAMFPRGSFC